MKYSAPLRWVACIWLAGWLSLAVTGSAQPLNFSISPTSFILDSSKTLSGQTRFTNVSPQPAVFTVDVYSWLRVDGRDQLSPTRDVLVSPSRFVLQPGSSQVIRVAVQRKPGQDELTYRVLLRQVIPEQGELAAGQEVAAQIQGLVELSLPVYVVPPTAAARISYQVERSTDGKNLTLAFSNTGNRSYLMKGLKVTAGIAPGRAAADLPQSFLIFRGTTYRVSLPTFGNESQLAFSFVTPDSRIIDEKIQVP